LPTQYHHVYHQVHRPTLALKFREQCKMNLLALKCCNKIMRTIHLHDRVILQRYPRSCIALPLRHKSLATLHPPKQSSIPKKSTTSQIITKPNHSDHPSKYFPRLYFRLPQTSPSAVKTFFYHLRLKINVNLHHLIAAFNGLKYSWVRRYPASLPPAPCVDGMER
jgi:hypothetical protein